jgi:hypothetical protein
VTAKSYKPNFAFTQPFDFTKLMKLSETLGEINFELKGAGRDVVGIWRGAISGNMKVSFQAARSIG